MEQVLAHNKNLQSSIVFYSVYTIYITLTHADQNICSIKILYI